MRTAAEAGWHESRYNLRVHVPNTGNVAIANLLRGTCAEYGPMELYALSALDELSERHPMVARLARNGVICNYDERAAVEAMGRMVCSYGGPVSLTICPTMGCNFDCPYCFENHVSGKMPPDVQDDVVGLAERMMEVSGAKALRVTWFGGEPLLAPDVIESLSALLARAANARGATYEADIITNGYLLTGDVAALLKRAHVTRAQVTLDGIGGAHDATRHLAGGEGTFARIVENLSRPGLPLAVKVRHNVHEGNRAQVEPLREFVAHLAAESKNELSYRAAIVSDNGVARDRGSQARPLGASEAGRLIASQAARDFAKGRGHHCGAHRLLSIGIDERGRLQKCWEAVDKPHLSFGTARDWDPANPLATASNPGTLAAYLNTAAPVPDPECDECVWLPLCVGGCPHRRLFGDGRRCTVHKADPERYVLALLARLRDPMGRQPQDGVKL